MSQGTHTQARSHLGAAPPRASPAFLHETVFGRPWVIPANALYYYDAEFADRSAREWTFKTVPRNEVRFAFQLTRAEQLQSGDWAVSVLPVPLDLGPDAESAAAHRSELRPTPKRLKLVHRGCMAFELASLPAADMGLQRSVGLLAEKGAAQTPEPLMTIPLQPHQTIAASGTTPFEVLTGDAGQALEALLKLAHAERASESLTAARLMSLRKPAKVARSAWDAAVQQISLEAAAREICDRYFQRCEMFIHEVFIKESPQVVAIAELCELDRPIDDKQLIDGAFQLMSAALKAVDIPGFSIVSGGLSAAYGYLASQRDAKVGEAQKAVTVGQAAESFATIFDNLIDAIHEGRKAVFNDWGLLSGLAELLGRTLALADPTLNTQLKADTTKALKIAIWKVVLKQRWHDVHEAKGVWTASYTAAAKKLYEQAHRGHYVTFQPGGNPNDKHHAPGFFVYDHYLGRVSGGLYAPNPPDNAMLDELFGTLGVTVDAIFTQWGLVSEAYTLPDPYGPNYFPGF